MKRALVLSILLVATGVGMLYRARADYRILKSAEAATGVKPQFHSIPPLAGFDAAGQPVTVPKDAQRIALFVLRQKDQDEQLTFWRRVLSDLGSNGRFAVVAVRESIGGAPVQAPDPRFIVVSYADYVPLSFLADLNRRNQVAVLDGDWVIRQRLALAVVPGRMEEALR